MHKSPTGPYLYQKETKVFHLIVTTNIRCDNEKKSSSSAANNQSALACKTINEISGRNKWQVHFQKLLSNNPTCLVLTCLVMRWKKIGDSPFNIKIGSFTPDKLHKTKNRIYLKFLQLGLQQRTN